MFQNTTTTFNPVFNILKPFFIFLIFSTLSVRITAQPATTSFEVDGIKVIYKPTVKEIINVSMYFRGGVSNYPAAKAGIENMALIATTECGTKKYTKNDFKNIEDQYGISVSGASDYDYGKIQLNCISKYFNEGWKLFEEAINNPVFDARELELIKVKLVSAIRQSESQPDNFIEDIAVRSAFKNTPYAIDPKGDERTITGFSQSEIAAYYKQLLNKNSMYLVVVGKVTKEELTAKIRASFAWLPAKPYKPVNLGAPVFKENTLLIQNRELATNYVTGIVNAPKMTSNDYVPFRLAISMLSGGLFRELRTRLNLSYNPGASNTVLQMPYASLFVSTTDPKAAVEAILEQVKRLKSGEVKEENLEYLKGSYITNNYMKQESSASIAANLGQAEALGGWRMAEELPDKINQATPAQVLEAAKKYITGIRWSYLGDAKLAEKASAAFNTPVF